MNKKDLVKNPSFKNTTDELKDLLAGDKSILERPEFKNLDLQKLKIALDFITNNPNLNEGQRKDLVENSWKINYRSKPPTPEEFLTEKYLGPTATHTYDRIKKVFCEFLDPQQPCRDLILYPHIGWGKLMYSQEKVMIPEGYRKIEDMKVGDTVITPDCGTAKVSAVQHFPDMPIYKITFGDGRVSYAGGPHYWKAARSYDNTYWDKEQKKYVPYPKTSPKRPCWKIITTEEILKDIESHPNQNRGWFIPLTKPAAHKERTHVISPYVVGALIGDGSIHKNVTIGNDDKEILDRILKESKEDWISAYSNCEDLKTLKRSSVKYKIRFRRGGVFNEELARLGLANTYSYEKFIPEEYKYDSIENRIALLQGLMDTDGSAEKHGGRSGACYYTSSERLKDDFVELCSGLGASRCVVHVDRSPRKNNGAPRKNNREYKCYRIDVTFPDNSFPIFGLERKQQYIDAEYSKDKLGYKKQRKPQVLHIKSIEKTDLKGGTCIETDDEERLFLTNNYIVTHNSYLSTLITLYITTCVTMMRDPYKFFGLNPATNLVQLLISYSLKKSSELLLEPYMQILGASPFFEKVHTKEGMVKAQAEFAENEEITKIYYTTASPTSALEFSGNLKIKLTSSVQGLLGLSVISAVLSELAFFIDAGKSSEYIMRMYNDTKSRIETRMHGNYFGRSILDSSPNTLDSAIDDFIVNEAHKDPKNYIVEGSMWKWEPEDYDMTHTFSVFIGGRGNPPRILGANDPLLTDESSDRSKIIQVPESQRSFFEADLIKSLKDRAGIPSGSADNLIYDYNLIENIFNNKLVNIYTHIYAPADEMPSGLIWNQVYSNFFNKKAGRFEYYYKPHIPRCVSVDQSIKTDLTSISMSHVERLGDTGELCYVTDFTIVIAPKKGGKINLDAIRSFIIDLRDKGNLHIDHVSFDQFQSEAAVQGLQRVGFNVEILSVDRTLGPYENLISMISTGRYFCGRNIHLKNNLKGLHLVRPKVKNGKPKIDHDATREPIVEADDTRWETSYIGSFSKDCADSVCASVELCHRYYEHSEDTWNPRALAQMFSKKKVAQDKDSVLKIIKGKGWLL